MIRIPLINKVLRQNSITANKEVSIDEDIAQATGKRKAMLIEIKKMLNHPKWIAYMEKSKAEGNTLGDYLDGQGGGYGS